ncbi:hypothetical protein N657DRAFT_653093 [Parathielavia appendiculata]|uniref:Uncharacterized protein n=1 Tax=Parathielavia appendiculata TaxID=2587402 RepID=A0AAN6UC40_9PEZI|nr:hypothetical protein N657DRAFT_653093 [Parathielavia appendiculata]
MDRGRINITSRGRAAKKRATFPSHSFQTQSHPFSNSASPTTPEPSAVLTSSQRMAYTAPHRGGKARQANSHSSTPHRALSPAADQALRITARTDRPARNSTFHTSSSFSFESPSTAGSIMAAARKRSKTLETAYDGAADDEGHSKGGHSLRKRARIDYTQEMIEDDLGLPAIKNELVVKPATTPIARSRKRKGGHDDSGGESEDFTSASHPKRHRTDKSPAPSRAASFRRRNPSKRLPADPTLYVDQPSDNEVQDTILVSLPTGPGLPSEEESEPSSPSREPESRSTSSDESEIARIHVQPPTPQVQPSRLVEDAVSLAAEDGEAIEVDINPKQPDKNVGVAPRDSPLTSSVEPEQPLGASEDGVQQSDLNVPAIQRPKPIILPDPARGAVKSETKTAKETIPRSQDEFSRQATTAEAIEIPAASNTSTPASNPLDDSRLLQPPEDETLRPSFAQALPDQGPKPAGSSMIKSLERIYKRTTPFASHLKLTPYEDEGVTLPGPYTEWVHPVRTAKDQSTPLLMPTRVPSPLEGKPAEDEWDVRRPLKTSEFFALYRRECQKRQENGEPPISMIEFNNECARRYKSAHSEDPTSATTPASTTESTASSTVVAQRPGDLVVPSVEDETPRASQAVESPVPTTAPSPARAEEDPMIQDEAADDEQDADEPLDDPVKPDSPGEPVEVTRYPNKQYLFPKIRDPNEFVEAFEGWQDLSTEHLYELTAAATEALDAYQQEYNELKKLLDDEENAKRRQANDKTMANWENRQKVDEPLPLRRHFDDTVKGPAVFEVRGVRAPKPYIDDPVLEHQKEEDRVMAQAYGFKLNTHPTQVGRQNPEEQRWEMPENRLRKRTEKGAELADENVVEGKRARKPRHVSDQSNYPSRSGTPTGFSTFASGRRQRRKPAGAAGNGDDVESLEHAQLAESFSESLLKGRPARVREMVLAEEQDQITPVADPDNNRTDDEQVKTDEKPKVSRRRGRGVSTLHEPPTSILAGSGGELNRVKRVRGGKSQLGNHQAAGEIASSSFYSNASTHAESRPSTASSDGTAHTAETVESAYSLRDKRKRNFALENDPELETRPQRRGRGAAAQKQDVVEPKKRGPRKKDPAAEESLPPPDSAPSHTPRPANSPPLQQPMATKFYHNFVAGPMMVDVSNSSQPVPSQAAGPFLHTFNATPAFIHGTPPPPPAPPVVKKPITKIKFRSHGTTSQAASRTVMPANGASDGKKRSRGKKAEEAKANAAANGDGEPDKPYAEMTKSEKMSWSMRRRWASGEMQGAVEKRRNTLASKKAEKASANGSLPPEGADAVAVGQTDSGPGSAGPSGPTTPASMHSQSGSGSAGLLALPKAHPVILPAPVPHPPQAYLQQPPPPYPYALPPGPPGPML